MVNHSFKKLSILAYKNLFRNKRRSLFTLCIAATGFIAMALTMGYYSFSLYGLQEMTIGLGFSGEGGTGHLRVIDTRNMEQDEAYLMEFGIIEYDSISSVIGGIENVDYVLPRIQFGGLISNGDKSLPVIGYGIDPEKEIKLRAGLRKLRDDWKAGNDIAPLLNNQDGILLGSKLASSLNASIGDFLMLYASTIDGAVNAIDVELVGITATGMDIIDKFYVSTHLTTVQRLINSDRITQFNVMLKDRNQLDPSISRIMNKLDQNQYTLTPWYDLGKFYNSIKDIFKVIFSFNGIIIIIIVLLSCWNIINMTTMERSKEIGTLRAMGIDIRYIIQIILSEAFILGIAGVLIGFVLQLIIANLINTIGIHMPPIPGQSNSYLLKIHPWTWYQIPIGASIILATTISGLSSLFIIRRMSIVDSLDYA